MINNFGKTQLYACKFSCLNCCHILINYYSKKQTYKAIMQKLVSVRSIKGAKELTILTNQYMIHLTIYPEKCLDILQLTKENEKLYTLYYLLGHTGEKHD